jgi:hypothetical protein
MNLHAFIFASQSSQSLDILDAWISHLNTDGQPSKLPAFK